MERIVKKILIPAFILASTLSVTATAADDSGWFAGAAIGQSDIDASGISFDEDTSYKLFAGYDFTRNWALGVEYADLGEFDVTSSLPAGVTAFTEVDGFNFYGMYSHHINDSFSLFAKAGIFIWDVTAVASGPGGTATASEDDSDFSWGLGGAFNMTDSAALTLEFQRFDIGDDEVDTITGGITFRF